jgi:hypothetical protein
MAWIGVDMIGLVGSDSSGKGPYPHAAAYESSVTTGQITGQRRAPMSREDPHCRLGESAWSNIAASLSRPGRQVEARAVGSTCAWPAAQVEARVEVRCRPGGGLGTNVGGRRAGVARDRGTLRRRLSSR